MTTDTSERGLEERICTALTASPCKPGATAANTVAERSATYGVGWICGDPNNYNREFCVDLEQLSTFLHETQPEIAETLDLDEDSPTRRRFLTRLQTKIFKRGTIHVLRYGLKHGQHNLNLFYSTPSPDNKEAEKLYKTNRFSVTRQLRYSLNKKSNALDLGLFINGLPVATFELKNNLTKQNVEDAVQQYKRDRDPREKLFEFGRCVAHFAVDENEVRFCTHLNAKKSVFLPFNCGCNDGAGNPPNPNGLRTDYLWEKILTRESLTNILENYAQVITTKTQIWPRFHQLEVVRHLLADAEAQGAGKRYLIQHSAGSGKSNSIAWLAHQLIGLKKNSKEVFDSIIVVTDRRILDQQIRDTIKQFAQVGSTVGHAKRSNDLREFIEGGKKIIISTVQKFPHILDEISNEQRGRSFAIIIDEAHSSQGGKTSAAVNQALADPEDTINDILDKRMKTKKMLKNASYFAFTATPKNKTLEVFGGPAPQTDGAVKHLPFHSYTMKQAIQEEFILDVLENYTPVDSYYRLIKTVENDPAFDAKRAKKKLRRYVENHEHAIKIKAEIMVDHFHKQVLRVRKVNSQARAMVVTGSIRQALQYFHAISSYLNECKSSYKAIAAFSGEHDYDGAKVTEASLNGFPANEITDRIQKDPYRFLVCADKFQTGYDEPLLHTMYVDKVLSDIKAVQTLSRLNRSHPGKRDVFVLDFMNDTDTIKKAFADYYRTTILSEETDPNRLHDLKAELDDYQIYTPEQIDDFVERYLKGKDRNQLDPILDVCVEKYKEQLDEDEQVNFKGKSKTFIRTYEFLSSILPYTNAEWEKLSIFLNFLVLKLPTPKDEDLSKGILKAIDMDSYRVEKQAVQKIQLPDQDGVIDPVPPDGGGGKPEPEMDLLSSIINDFNTKFGNIQWNNLDRVRKCITEDIPKRVASHSKYINAMKNSDQQNARTEYEKALKLEMAALIEDDEQLSRLFMDNASFKRWMTDTIFNLTYEKTE